MNHTQRISVESEARSNKYAIGTTGVIVVALLGVLILNEMNIFGMDRVTMRICFIGVFAMHLLLALGSRKKSIMEHPAFKYVVMADVILMIFLLSVELNIYVTMGLIFPMLLAAQYESYGITGLAIVGSAVCSITAPILSYEWNTFSLSYLTGYMETVCHVTISQVTEGSPFTEAESIRRVVLFLGFPQFIMLCVMSIVILTITKHRKASLATSIREAELGDDLALQLQRVEELQDKMLYSMADIIENRDGNTGYHVRRTSDVVRILVDHIRKADPELLTEEFAQAVIKSAPLHDLGKISISDCILCKPGALTEEERKIIQTHPVKSAEIIDHVLQGVQNQEFLQVAHNLALYHHERIDGRGYPEHLTGENIPLEARIMTIADCYDAMVSKRCYKAAMSPQEAKEEILRGAGTQFDAKLVGYFEQCCGEIEEYYRNIPQ